MLTSDFSWTAARARIRDPPKQQQPQEVDVGQECHVLNEEFAL